MLRLMQQSTSVSNTKNQHFLNSPLLCIVLLIFQRICYYNMACWLCNIYFYRVYFVLKFILKENNIQIISFYYLNLKMAAVENYVLFIESAIIKGNKIFNYLCHFVMQLVEQLYFSFLLIRKQNV